MSHDFNFGCRYCGASSEEACMTISGTDARKPHADRVFRQHEYEALKAAQKRIADFFVGTPEPEGTIDEICNETLAAQYERIMNPS